MVDRRKRDDVVRAVDLFCGAGGLSAGLAVTCRQLDRETELSAVNHWNMAIKSHKANYPEADHYHAKIDELDPREVVPGERVEILTAGPECTHFSNARGSRPVEEQPRATPWDILEWCQKLYIDNVIIENVPEFESWAPVGADGQPMKSKEGETFDAFVNALHSLGYSVDWQVLDSSEYGDATSRRRLFLICRRQGRPEFPEPTHSENGEKPGTKPKRIAAEIIDWTDIGESIWERNIPLVNNTMKRIAEGVRRHGHPDLEPFADAVGSLGKEDVAEMQEDIVSIENVQQALDERDSPFLVQGEVPELQATDEVDVEMETDTGLCLPYLLGQQSGSVPRDVTERPVPTIATRGAIGLYQPTTFVLPRNGYHRGLHSNSTYDPDDQPLHTVTARNHDGHVITPYLTPFYGERAGQAPRTHDIDEPVPTVTATGSQPAVTRPYLIQYHGNSDSRPIDEPLPTVTTRDSLALCLPTQSSFGLDVKFRMLKVDELAAAMGFPSDYVFKGNKTEITKQIGNAVPVNLAAALVERVLVGREPTIRTFNSQSAQPEAIVDGGESTTPEDGED